MNWRWRYHFSLYFRNSLWILPALSILMALATVSLLTRYEQSVGSYASVSVESVRVIMSTVAGSTFTLVVLVSSAVLVAIQLASAQLTPRIISMVYRTPYQKLAFAVFVYTFTFSVSVLARIDESAPRIASYLAAYGFLLDLALFILFIDNVGKMLRPSSAVRAVARTGREVIRAAYPQLLKEDTGSPVAIKAITNKVPRTVLNTIDGVVLAFDMKGLVTLAQRSECLIELVPEVGQFVAEGDPLFRIYGGGDRSGDSSLRNSVAVGEERTPEQDPLFAFRIIVDIANKALSPAINDPTTAVIAVDQIHHLLRDVGKRYLGDGRGTDRTGKIRLVYRTPNWEDFVQVATTEIRHYGHDSMQVQRRLRAMLTDLIETLPVRRAGILEQELRLLATSSKRNFQDPDDVHLAEAGDLQGIGGSSDDVEGSQSAENKQDQPSWHKLPVR
jgi:uncharacterized membrane protein